MFLLLRVALTYLHTLTDVPTATEFLTVPCTADAHCMPTCTLVHTSVHIVRCFKTNLFLDKLVPVFVGERACADDDLVPVTSEVVIRRLLGDPLAIELQTAGNLFLRFEDHQRHLRNTPAASIRITGTCVTHQRPQSESLAPA